MNKDNFDFLRFPRLLRELPHSLDITQSLPLLTIFLVLYIPFLFQYGWGYRSTKFLDFPSFYATSESVFKYGESPYDLKYLRKLNTTDEHVYPFLYPPTSLLLFFPLSTLNYVDARLAVLIINHLLFLALIWAMPLFLLHSGPGKRFGVIAICFVYSLTFYPVILTLNHGQVNLALLASLILFWLLSRKGNAKLASFFLALAILLKTHPLIILLMLPLIGRWRESFYTIAWLALATIISLLVLPTTVWHDWASNVLPAAGYLHAPQGLSSPAMFNQGLNGFFARTFTASEWSHPLWVNPRIGKLLAYASAGLILAITSFAVWYTRAAPNSLDRMVLVSLPAIYLVSPISWEHHIVYLLPGILMLLNSRSKFGLAPNLVFYPLCIVSAAILGAPWTLDFKFYAVVILWGLSVFACCSEKIELPIKAAHLNTL
jgi:hypothetical protein